MPGVTNPVTMPLIGATSPMPSMPVMPPGSGQVPQVPLAQFGSPSSLGMFGNFTNVSHQMGSQMGYPNESNAPQSQTMSGNQHFCGSRELWRVLSAELMSWTMQCTHNSDFSFGFLDQTAGPSASPQVSSAFEMLGKSPATATQVNGVSNEETMMKALIAALSGDRKLIPSWNGNVETLRAWLQLSLWELDNNLPKSRWGLKLMQSFAEGSAPRKIAETIDIPTLTSDAGYGAILSAILAKYSPFLEAAGPAAVETFFYGCERAKNESFSTYVAAKEVERWNHILENVCQPR